MHEAKDIVDQQQHVLPFFVPKIFGHGQGGIAHQKPYAGGLVHLTEEHHGLVAHTRLAHFPVKFLGLARPVGGHRAPTELLALSREVVALAAPRAEDAGVTLELDGASVEASVDADALRFGLVNLVNNALDASQRGGRIEVRVMRDGDLARIEVRDEGAGLDPEIAERLFDPFVTGRPEGTGLGLPITRAMAREHGGDLTLENAPGGGALARLSLPLEPGRERAP